RHPHPHRPRSGLHGRNRRRPRRSDERGHLRRPSAGGGRMRTRWYRIIRHDVPCAAYVSRNKQRCPNLATWRLLSVESDVSWCDQHRSKWMYGTAFAKAMEDRRRGRRTLLTRWLEEERRRLTRLLDEG